MKKQVQKMLINFDYDGVIVDSFDELLDIAIRASEEFPASRKPAKEDFHSIENLTFLDLGQLIGLNGDDAKQYSDAVFSEQKKSWSVSLFPTIAEVFSELSKYHTLVVITASESQVVSENLTALGIRDTITKVLGGELGLSKSDRIDMVCKELGFEKCETLMVGDAISDIRQGKLANVTTVAVTWGFQDKQLLAREQPDFQISEPAELLEIYPK
ncbi:HAD family hydrolase [Porticoccus sp. W117]|uniref:HAD family hydrolase n=1 Tax=Porticoccus sp. W117 TaxID=3054777 RepID=UPI0025918C2E|nr:HAD family hydrolase [Porticoccus sp. W117]MDM3870094.1 HAD family hydrolase [Porticoccus sp. W117]